MAALISVVVVFFSVFFKLIFGGAKEKNMSEAMSYDIWIVVVWLLYVTEFWGIFAGYVEKSKPEATMETSTQRGEDRGEGRRHVRVRITTKPVVSIDSCGTDTNRL